MLERSRGTVYADDIIDMSRLRQLVYWGSAAAVALALAVIAGRSETGGAPIKGSMREQANHTHPATSFDAQAETQRLAEQVRVLTADRDRLKKRLASLERNLDNVTGSVERKIRAVRAAATAPKPAPPAAPPQAEPTATKPTAAKPAPTAMKPAAAKTAAAPPMQKQKPAPKPKQVAAVPAHTAPPPAAASPARLPLPRPGPVVSARSSGGIITTIPLTHLRATAGDTPDKLTMAGKQFGIDIDGTATIQELHSDWTKLQKAHPKLLDGLRPPASIRDVAKRRRVELRLVVGPLADAETAAKLCAALVTAGLHSCRTSPFEGQQLAKR